MLDFDLKKQKSFGPGQICTELSRMKKYDKLFFIRKYKRSSIKVNVDAVYEYGRLKDYCLFSTIDRNAVSDDTLTIFILNLRSGAKYLNDIVHDCRCLKNDAIRFAESQMKNLNKINNKNYEFLSLVYGCQDDIAIY